MTWRAVFSRPPATISHAEFNRWYDDHLDEILAFPGFLEARRYSVTPLGGHGGPGSYPFGSLYRIDGDPEATNLVVRAAVTAGEIVHPDWFPLPRSSWSFFPLADHAIDSFADELVLVAATVPRDVAVADAPGWYSTTIERSFRERLGEAKQFRMVSSMTNADAPSTYDILGLHECPWRSSDLPPDLSDGVAVVGLEALGPAKVAR